MVEKKVKLEVSDGWFVEVPANNVVDIPKEDKLKETREMIYEALHEVWSNAEGIDERELERRTYQIMNKLRAIEGD